MFEKELSFVFSIGTPAQDCERLFSAVEGGRFSLSYILSHTMPLDDAAKAYRDFDEKRALKVVLIP
jgi:threonine dehydrogenase-like Zn-dependent dehydrogenase